MTGIDRGIAQLDLLPFALQGELSTLPREELVLHHRLEALIDGTAVHGHVTQQAKACGLDTARKMQAEITGLAALYSELPQGLLLFQWNAIFGFIQLVRIDTRRL